MNFNSMNGEFLGILTDFITQTADRILGGCADFVEQKFVCAEELEEVDDFLVGDICATVGHKLHSHGTAIPEIAVEGLRSRGRLFDNCNCGGFTEKQFSQFCVVPHIMALGGNRTGRIVQVVCDFGSAPSCELVQRINLRKVHIVETVLTRIGERAHLGHSSKHRDSSHF